MILLMFHAASFCPTRSYLPVGLDITAMFLVWLCEETMHANALCIKKRPMPCPTFFNCFRMKRN